MTEPNLLQCMGWGGSFFFLGVGVGVIGVYLAFKMTLALSKPPKLKP